MNTATAGGAVAHPVVPAPVVNECDPTELAAPPPVAGFASQNPDMMLQDCADFEFISKLIVS